VFGGLAFVSGDANTADADDEPASIDRALEKSGSNGPAKRRRSATAVCRVSPLRLARAVDHGPNVARDYSDDEDQTLKRSGAENRTPFSKHR
jgi:hypothetical protein